mgnify:CR=1 FL=1
MLFRSCEHDGSGVDGWGGNAPDGNGSLVVGADLFDDGGKDAGYACGGFCGSIGVSFFLLAVDALVIGAWGRVFAVVGRGTTAIRSHGVAATSEKALDTEGRKGAKNRAGGYGNVG